MEKSVFGSAIKTYPSKRNRFSSYRPSTLAFENDQDDIFNQLLEDEMQKQPILSKKFNPLRNTFRSTKSHQPNQVNIKAQRYGKNSLVLKNVQNVKFSDVKNQTDIHSRQIKHKKRMSKNTKAGKENTLKCNSRLFGNDSDTDDEYPGSIYDFPQSMNDLTKHKKYRKRKEKKYTESEQSSPSNSAKTTPNNCNFSKNDFLAPKSLRNETNCCENIEEISISDKFDLLKQQEKPNETTFKKPVQIVERSSDLFFKNAFKNQGQSRTRKKLPFPPENYDHDCKYNADKSFESDNEYSNMSGICRSSELCHTSDCFNELFNLDDRRCSNFNVTVDENFEPGVNSTPNFHRNSSVSFNSNLQVQDNPKFSLLHSLKTPACSRYSFNLTSPSKSSKLSTKFEEDVLPDPQISNINVQQDLENEADNIAHDEVHNSRENSLNSVLNTSSNSDSEKTESNNSSSISFSNKSDYETSADSSNSTSTSQNNPNSFPSNDQLPNSEDNLSYSFSSACSHESKLETSFNRLTPDVIPTTDDEISPQFQTCILNQSGLDVSNRLTSRSNDGIDNSTTSPDYLLNLSDRSTGMEKLFSELYLSRQSITQESNEFRATEEYPLISNRSCLTNNFIGWPYEAYKKALNCKQTLEKTLEKLKENSPQDSDTFYHVNDFASRLQYVTTRRKKNHPLPTLNEESEDHVTNVSMKIQTSQQLSQFVEKSPTLQPITLPAGKKFRRSYINLKNIQNFGMQLIYGDDTYKGRCWKKNMHDLISSQPNGNLKEIEECSTLSTNDTNISTYSTYAIQEKCNRLDKARFSLCVNTIEPDDSGGSVTSSDSGVFGKSFLSFVKPSRDSIECDFEAGDYSRCNLSLERYDIQDNFSAKEIVLRHCKQSEPLPFEECFNDCVLLNCKKIGEGVYGEVFMLRRSRTHCSVLKIMPIEGNRLVNGERQKKYEEIVSELIISIELSNLRRRRDFYTDNFAELQRCWCVYGRYPERLIDLWNEYDELKGSDNDSPKIFDDSQLYIILELSHGGEDIESFVFNNAQQAYSVFKQVTNALAVAEQAFMFEHRDLHWGNILVSRVKAKETKYIIGDSKKVVKLSGVKVTIIDYTLSRISINNCIVYNDIGQEPDFFTAEGDFQFEIYRLMKNEVQNIWKRFAPKTNVYWLHYLLDKMIKEIRYRRSNTRVHRANLTILEELYGFVLDFESAYRLSCDPIFD